MKELKSPAMKKLLAAGLRKAKKQQAPSDGNMRNLIYKTLPNGWHYQVEWVVDSRMSPMNKVVVYAFKPPRDFSARSATHFLHQSLAN